jgi:hypothetical protein
MEMNLIKIKLLVELFGDFTTHIGNIIETNDGLISRVVNRTNNCKRRSSHFKWWK